MPGLAVAVIGASGRMGRELCRAVLDDPECNLAGGTVRPGTGEVGLDLGLLCGSVEAGVVATEEPPEDADVHIEFTSPGATVAHLSYEKPVVIGTTGFSGGQISEVRKAAQNTAIVFAPNMSIGVSALREVVSEVSRKLGAAYDIEVVEAHHRRKKDAPSGTALFLGRAAAEGRGLDFDEVAVHGREGVSTRSEGEIGVHALRGGSVVGEHRVIFYGEGEEVEVIHRALSRKTFADGAVRAAKFAASATPGFYSMSDVLA